MTDQVSALWQMALAELVRANVDKKHPFRYMTLATLGTYPECRWVVSRNFSEQQEVLLYTDSRTPKVEQITSNPKVAVTWYHPRKKLQIRMKGIAEVLLSGPIYDKHYQMVKEYPDDYNTLLAPGTANDNSTVHTGDTNLAVIKIASLAFDILLLDRAGHQRAQLQKEHGEWTGKMVTA